MIPTIQSFTSLTLYLSVILTAVLTLILFKSKLQKISITLLISLMFFQLFSQLVTTLIVLNDSFATEALLYRSAYPFELSSPVLIYLYILSLTNPIFSWKSIRWYHAIPFLIGLVWWFSNLSFSLDLRLDKYFKNFVGLLLLLPYFWGSRKLIIEFQNQVKNQRSNLGEFRLPWLQFLLVVCYISVALTFLDLLTGPDIPLWLYRGGITNLALAGLTYYGLKTSELFQRDLKSSTNNDHLNSEESAVLSAQLLKRLKDDSLYLKPQIRLAEIADEMGIKSYKLSEVINQGLNTNFYELINGLRLEHAMHLMHDPKSDHLNLLGIAMDSGFNSKSVFNDYFRRKTGMTPSEYRQQRSNPTESIT